MQGTRKICASIMPQSAQELKEILREVGRRRPDCIELRLDMLPKGEIETALGTLKIETMQKTILTLRSKEEGGHYEGSDQERKGIIDILAEQPAKFVDIEGKFAARNWVFVNNLKHMGVRMIISHHNFKRTPQPAELQNLYLEMSQMGKIAKIVTTAQSPLDNLSIFKLYDLAKAKGDLISFAMGGYGQISRIMSITHYGAPFAYCSLGEPVAPGMLSVREMRRIIRSVP